MFGGKIILAMDAGSCAIAWLIRDISVIRPIDVGQARGRCTFGLTRGLESGLFFTFLVGLFNANFGRVKGVLLFNI